MAIRYYNEGSDYRLRGKRRIGTWIKATIYAEGFEPGDISFVFCSQAHHLEINRHYLGHDYQTDVITFDYSDLKDSRTVSGDIFIDPMMVTENAGSYGVNPYNEMLRVIIHGVLHLCGYKDKTAAEQKEMRFKEDLYLRLFERP